MARQTGLESSSSDWIAILDSDDRWLPRKLELQMAARDGFDIVLCWFAWIAPDGSVRVERRLSGQGWVSPTLTNNHDVPLMRRTTLWHAGGFVADAATPTRFDDNTDFFIRLLTSGRTTVVPETLVWCSDHAGLRDSDGVSQEAESLRSVVEARAAQLAPWPDASSELYARVSARYFARHEPRNGLSWAWRAVRIGSLGQRWASFRRSVPYGMRQIAGDIRKRPRDRQG